MNISKSATAILLGALALGCGTLAAQVLNISHNLVPLGIASQNLTTNKSVARCQTAFSGGSPVRPEPSVQRLTLDRGAYYLLTNTQANAVRIFVNLSDLTVDLAGSTLYFNFNAPLVLSLQLYYCSNVTLDQFSIDYVHPPYTHMQLTSVDTVNPFEIPDSGQLAESQLVQYAHRSFFRRADSRILGSNFPQRFHRSGNYPNSLTAWRGDNGAVGRIGRNAPY